MNDTPANKNNCNQVEIDQKSIYNDLPEWLVRKGLLCKRLRTHKKTLKALDLTQTAQLKRPNATDVYINDVDANDIDANDIDANDIDANDIDVNDIDANDVYINDIDANDIDANDVYKNDIDANKCFTRKMQTTRQRSMAFRRDEIGARSLKLKI